MVKFDRFNFMIHFSIMKTATVADLRNHFRRVSAWIEDGQTVAIVKRGRLFARLVPIAQSKRVKKINFQAQRKRIWGDRIISATEVQSMNDAEIAGEEG
jgi:antitoxin (DNA-binding transcriptional repressor) of toxin-antitoxin stability system